MRPCTIRRLWREYQGTTHSSSVTKFQWYLTDRFPLLAPILTKRRIERALYLR